MQIDELKEECIRLLLDLVSIPSVSGQEGEAANFMEGYLGALEPHALKRVGNNLIAIWYGLQPGPTLLLCSHIDTVAPSAGWTRNPYKGSIEGERIYGLGANDAGASVVSMIGAVRAVTPLIRGQIILCLAAEEEAGSNGFVAIEPTIPRYDAAIFGEPTNMGVAREMRGAMKVVVQSRGIACHASRPWEGRNAIDTFAYDLSKLRSLALNDDSLWGGATVEPTTIRGGSSSNQIPDLITTILDIRTTPKRDNDWVLEQLRELGIEFSIENNRRRPMRSMPDHPLVRAIARAVPNFSEYTFNGTCDMAFSAAASVVMGPGRSERSHASDEFCTRDEIGEAVETYAEVIKSYLSVAD